MRGYKTKKLIATMAFGLMLGVPVLQALAAESGPTLPGLGSVPIVAPQQFLSNTTDLFYQQLANLDKYLSDNKCELIGKFSAATQTLTSQVSAAALIGDNSALIAALNKEKAELKVAQTCREGLRTKILKTEIGDTTDDLLTQANKLKTRQTALERLDLEIKQLQDYQKRIDELLVTATQSVWKAILIKTASVFVQNLAGQALNKLNSELANKYPSIYGPTLARTIYTVGVIAGSKSPNKDKLILHSMLNNPLIIQQEQRWGINPMYNAAADAALGYNLKKVSYTDPNFLDQLARVPDASPYAQAANYQTQAGAVQQQAAQMSQAEASLAYKSTYNCDQAIQADQKQIDSEYAALLDEYQDRRSKYYAMTAPDPNIPAYGGADSDAYKRDKEVYDKYERDYEAALKKVEEFDKKYKDPVTMPCRIMSNGSNIQNLVKSFIDGQINKLFNPDSNNLPYTAAEATIGNIIGQLLTQGILGGGVNGYVIQNAGTTAAITATAGLSPGSGSGSGTSGPKLFTYQVSNNTIRVTFTIPPNIEYDNLSLYIDGIYGTKDETKDYVAPFDASKPHTISLKLFKPVNQNDPQTAGFEEVASYVERYTPGSVRGASVQVIHPRGEPLKIKPRGE